MADFIIKQWRRGLMRKLACVATLPLHPVDGLRGAPDRKRAAIRSAGGMERSFRAIIPHKARPAAF